MAAPSEIVNPRPWDKPFPRAFDAGAGTLYERFSSYVHRRQDHQCWLWTGALTAPNSYGQIGEWVDNKRMSRRAHRLAWEFCFGPIPEGLLVRHMCHNPRRCNPTHLLLGTHKDNFEDKIRAKREGTSVMLKGEDNVNSKLTEKQVQEIRATTGKTVRQMAKEYGVSKTLISAVRCGKAWKSFI